MTGVWVDTDLGFDDLWALLLLRRLGARVAGISLVAGVVPMPQVIANAAGMARAYGLDAPMYIGAEHPLQRAPETAERILGPTGLQSRGRGLPDPAERVKLPGGAVAALARWLETAAPDAGATVLAIGPLTNIALLLRDHPAAASRIGRLVWMGGSAGAGNHSAMAEFNALADPHAASRVAGAGLPLDVVDLTLCRRVSFGPADMPRTDALTSDLLGGYLDIGLSRGRDTMTIYDPVAALAAVRPELFMHRRCRMQVSLDPGDSLGATRFDPDPGASTKLFTGFSQPSPEAGERIAGLCLEALSGVTADAT